MSMAKAINVKAAARKDRMDAIRVTVRCWEKENKRAKKITMAATGCTARPRVQLELIITFAVLWGFWIEILYACPRE
jgi:hypothetical protein